MEFKKKMALTFAAIGLSVLSHAQTGIGTFTPDKSARLDIYSDKTGFLMPRVALVRTTQQSPVTAPATSLMVYNTATSNDVTPGYYYWDGQKWSRIAKSDELTFNNGLTAANGNVQLGGALTKPSVLTTTASSTLAIQGLQTGAPSDNVLVADANGVLKYVTRASLGGGADNLGNHIATQNLMMNRNDVVFADRQTSNTKTFSIYKDNSVFGIYNSSKSSNSLSITESGNVGIGTNAPTNALHIKASADPVKFEGLTTNSNPIPGTDYTLIIGNDGIVKKTEINEPVLPGVSAKLVASAGFNSESDAFKGPDLGSTICALIFKGKRFDPGNVYNNATGIFTAPADGYYKFECVILLYNSAGTDLRNTFARVGISKPGQTTFSNGNASFSSLNQPLLSSTGSSTPIVIPYSGMQKMLKGQVCAFGVRYFDNNWNLRVSNINYDVTMSSYMSITLIGN